jgi:hypothetical protein
VEKSDGAKALFACKMFEAGAVDAEWTDGMLQSDSSTHINTLIFLAHKVRKGDVLLASRYSNLITQKTPDEVIAILGGVK